LKYGEAAFYGPKLDFMVKDALGRKWQLGTIQVDYQLPQRFELEYTGSDNMKHRPSDDSPGTIWFFRAFRSYFN
jgi:threonyl-tRNA synthetase